MRQQLVNKRPVELLRDRELWKTRVEEKQHFQAKKKEAWEFFSRGAELQIQGAGGIRGRSQAEGDDSILLQRQP